MWFMVYSTMLKLVQEFIKQLLEGKKLTSMQTRIIKASNHPKLFGIFNLHQLTSKVRIVANRLHLQSS